MIELPLTPRVSLRLSLQDCFVGAHYHSDEECLTLCPIPLMSVRLYLGMAPGAPERTGSDTKTLSLKVRGEPA